jgi:hypothetical protein
MSDDLIKRDDALAAITLGATVITLQSRIRTLPAVPTHRYAGESEASVYNRKGFPPIGLQGHAHAPVADSHPAIDPAAIREAALQALIKDLEEQCSVYARSDRLFIEEIKELEAKFAKAIEALRFYAPTKRQLGERWFIQNFGGRDDGERAAAVLAELEGGK